MMGNESHNSFSNSFLVYFRCTLKLFKEGLSFDKCIHKVGYFLLQAVRCPGKYKLIVFMQYNTSVLSSYGSLAKSPFGKSGL